uniref:Large ribosomal subunit protein mL40 n=1 Tax=Latimeria chalumnae TaxID=7897 RepID=H3B5D0_LATCH
QHPLVSLCSALLSRSLSLLPETSQNAPMRGSHWQTSLLDLRNALPMRCRAEPRKKKRVDPKRELAAKERLKKKMKKLERIPPELIPIEDFTTPAKYLDETRRRDLPKLGFEESERRALLMKEWARYKQKQHEEEVEAVEAMLEAQREALQELRQESEELYQAAMKCDQGLIPLESHGPCNTPPLPGYQAPEGKYNDITRAYTQ